MGWRDHNFGTGVLVLGLGTRDKAVRRQAPHDAELFIRKLL